MTLPRRTVEASQALACREHGVAGVRQDAEPHRLHRLELGHPGLEVAEERLDRLRRRHRAELELRDLLDLVDRRGGR